MNALDGDSNAQVPGQPEGTTDRKPDRGPRGAQSALRKGGAWHSQLWSALRIPVAVGLLAGALWLSETLGFRIFADARDLATWGAPFAPFATPAVGLLAGMIALASHRQRVAADHRSEWWRQVSSAVDLTTSEDPQRQIAGAEYLLRLSETVDGWPIQHIPPRDIALLDSFRRILLNGSPEPSASAEPPAPTSTPR